MICGFINFFQLRKKAAADFAVPIETPSPAAGSVERHHPYELDLRFVAAFSEGDIDEIERLSREYSNYRLSTFCKGNDIRSLKNNLIYSSALLTKAAIDAGVDENYAYRTTERYINKVESEGSREKLLGLNGMLILDLAGRIKHSCSKTGKALSPLIKNALAFIDENYDKQLSLARLAAEVNANSSYLSRRFAEELGTSYKNYVNNLRLEKAKQLLLFSNRSISEIAFRLGFSSQSHFTNLFKKAFNATPGEFRNSD